MTHGPFAEQFSKNLTPIAFQRGTKLKDIEKHVILETLKHHRYNRTHAAKTLGIGVRTLQRKLKGYGLPNIGLMPEGAGADCQQFLTASAC
jgi:DNA-binding NtrC family response regulator